MQSPALSTDPLTPLVADTSAVINLIATGYASRILAAVPNRIVVVDVVPRELDTGRPRGRKDGDCLEELTAAGHVEVVTLSDIGWQHFEMLVAGPAPETLDDGEAATIAYAVEQNAIAVLDEKKGTRLSATRFPNLPLVSTVDILLHRAVRSKLGKKALADAVFGALRDARMKVFPHHLEAVVGLIGQERAGLCPSLPRSSRPQPAI